MAEHSPSPQQQVIIDEFEGGAGHSVDRARAGTGKTWTILKGINRAPEQSILLCAFNNRIAKELQTKLQNPRAKAQTLHSVGNSIVMKYWEGIRLCTNFDRKDQLTEKVCSPRDPDAIKKLVTKLCEKGREMAPYATTLGDLTDIAYTFECAPDEQWADSGYDLNYVEQKALDAMELAATVKPVLTGIDFVDMLYLPVRNRWLNKRYPLVVVDEGQDMNMTQLIIAEGVCSGRMCVVGDDRQAIYGFRGADSGSIDRLKLKLMAKEFPLTMTFRCAKAIVEAAQVYVPDFECPETAPEGLVSSIPFEKLTATAAAGDFILSRLNAPLVSVAMALLRSGKRTCIAGRDIGKGLLTLVRKFRARSIPDLISKIGSWEAKELQRVGKMRGDQQARADAVRDQAAMLVSLTDGARSVDDMTARIEGLFTDDGLGAAGVITCSSVHKSKGLEANRVFVLHSTLRFNESQEENNIAYVAITRAINELVWVTP